MANALLVEPSKLAKTVAFLQVLEEMNQSDDILVLILWGVPSSRTREGNLNRVSKGLIRNCSCHGALPEVIWYQGNKSGAVPP